MSNRLLCTFPLCILINFHDVLCTERSNSYTVISGFSEIGDVTFTTDLMFLPPSLGLQSFAHEMRTDDVYDIEFGETVRYTSCLLHHERNL
jgi:hypothetical protein